MWLVSFFWSTEFTPAPTKQISKLIQQTGLNGRSRPPTPKKKKRKHQAQIQTKEKG
jgi:hypothetical protein